MIDTRLRMLAPGAYAQPHNPSTNIFNILQNIVNARSVDQLPARFRESPNVERLLGARDVRDLPDQVQRGNFSQLIAPALLDPPQPPPPSGFHSRPLSGSSSAPPQPPSASGFHSTQPSGSSSASASGPSSSVIPAAHSAAPPIAPGPTAYCSSCKAHKDRAEFDNHARTGVLLNTCTRCRNKKKTER